MQLRPYNYADEATWDSFCEQAYNATFLHSRRFLSYHGDRFKDVSLIIEDEGKIIGLFPAAEHPSDSSLIVSHPGITYGGVVHQGKIRGERMLQALTAIRSHLKDAGYKKLLYKCVPSIYHRAPMQDDSYALFRLNAARVRCDLTSSIDLGQPLPVSERRKRSLKKAISAQVEKVNSLKNLPALWDVLSDNLSREHNASPVHSLAEITLLAERFAQNIQCVCALREGRVIAGVVLFITHSCTHAQYIASSEVGYEFCALDRVFAASIEEARQQQKKWFDFGISNEKAGLFLNDGLYRFKNEFGGGGVVHEYFELDLQP